MRDHSKSFWLPFHNSQEPSNLIVVPKMSLKKPTNLLICQRLQFERGKTELVLKLSWPARHYNAHVVSK